MPRLKLPGERTFIGPALVWKRIAAFFIDLMIVTLVLSFPFQSLLRKVLPKDYSFSEVFNLVSQDASAGTYLAAIYFSMSILTLVYFYVMEKKLSQTIGKKLMNIYVVSDTEQMKRWQLFVRNLMFIPIFPFDLLAIIDPLFMIFSKSGKRLSEILSRTRVVGKYNLDE